MRHQPIGPFLLAALATYSPSALAQRYLTEFVGTTAITTAPGLVIDTNLSFDLQDGRRLYGDFNYTGATPAGAVETDLFSTRALLLDGGKCPAKIQPLSGEPITGTLRMREFVFDAEVFALYGDFEVPSDPGALELTEGPLAGPTAMLQLAAEPLDILAREGEVTLTSTAGLRQELAVRLGELSRDGTIAGTLSDLRDRRLYEVVLTSTDRWLYLAGAAEGQWLVGRATVEVDPAGVAVGGSGTYSVLDLSGRALEEGELTLALPY